MGEKYAVLISGDLAETGFDEFWNDVVLMREVLIQNGFSDNYIFVLYGNGTDYFSTNRPNPRYRPSPAITDYQADIANVTTVLNGLANGSSGLPQLTNEDLLFIWTFDHGGSSGGGISTLGLMDGSMQDTVFAQLVDQIPHSYRVVCMQQCFSGGFIDNLRSDRTVIMTACAADEVAHRADSPAENEVDGGVTYHHGEFNYYLLAALSGQTITGMAVNADADGNGYVAMREVFDYIQAQESQPETPQYDDGTSNLGGKLYLRDIYIANTNTQEIHMEHCYWVTQMADSNKAPCRCLEEVAGLVRESGYNGCFYCLTRYDRDTLSEQQVLANLEEDLAD